MHIVIIAFLFILVTTEAKIKIEVEVGTNISDVEINYSGDDASVIGDKEIELFHLSTDNLKEAIARTSVYPAGVYLKSPTPGRDLYKRYKWEQVTRILKVKSARLKQSSVQTFVALTHIFENSFSNPITVNTALSQTVQNVIRTTWSRTQENTFSQEAEYGFETIYNGASGTTTYSYTSSVGKSEEKSESVTLGTITSMEMVLMPGEAVRSVLTANRYSLEIEVVYEVSLRGQVAIAYFEYYKDKIYDSRSIESVLESLHVENDLEMVENIQLGLYTDASLDIYDVKTGNIVKL